MATILDQPCTDPGCPLHGSGALHPLTAADVTRLRATTLLMLAQLERDPATVMRDMDAPGLSGIIVCLLRALETIDLLTGPRVVTS